MGESAWTVSNITAGNHTQIQVVIDAGCLQPLIDILVKGDFKAQKEAAWAVTNLTSGGTVQQIVHLCGEGVLKPFCDLLAAKDDKTVCGAGRAYQHPRHRREARRGGQGGHDG